MTKRITATLTRAALGIVLLSPALLASNVYNTSISYTGPKGPISITGTITTDGNTGTLTFADITAINWTLTADGEVDAATQLSDLTNTSSWKLTASGNNLLFAPDPSCCNLFSVQSDNFVDSKTGDEFSFDIVSSLEQNEFYAKGGSDLALDYLTFTNPATVTFGTLAPQTSTPEPGTFALIGIAACVFAGCKKLRP